jgi:DNA-binding transcriptional ArsR family regulator
VSADQSKEGQLLDALKHPLRRDILRKMAGEQAISPLEIADRVGQPLTNVAYHVRVLAKRQAIVMVNERPVRGSMQHFYRVNIEAPWAREILGLDPP